MSAEVEYHESVVRAGEPLLLKTEGVNFRIQVLDVKAMNGPNPLDGPFLRYRYVVIREHGPSAP